MNIRRLHPNQQPIFIGPDGPTNVPCYTNHCDGHFVRRMNRADGSVFYGCSNFPRCKTTISRDRMEDEITLASGEEPFDSSDFCRWDY